MRVLDRRGLAVNIKISMGTQERRGFKVDC